MKNGDRVNIDTLNMMGFECATTITAIHEDFEDREDILIFKYKCREYGIAIKENDGYYRVKYYNNCDFTFGYPELDYMRTVGKTQSIAIGLSKNDSNTFILLYNMNTNHKYYCETLYIGENYILIDNVPWASTHKIRVFTHDSKLKDVTQSLTDKLKDRKLLSITGVKDGAIVNMEYEEFKLGEQGVFTPEHAILDNNLDVEKIIKSTYVPMSFSGKGEVNYFKDSEITLGL